jgi:hypothetical protein
VLYFVRLTLCSSYGQPPVLLSTRFHIPFAQNRSFEGTICGPQVPDPNLPEAIRKNYHPDWNPMNASATKMVVHTIQKVQPLPPVIRARLQIPTRRNAVFPESRFKFQRAE